jgi:hypothetical protein
MSNPTDNVVSAGLRKDPTEFLKSIIHKPVVVKLNSGVDYRGAAQAHPCCSTCLCRSGLRRGSLSANAGPSAMWSCPASRAR